jgi:excisionase family DNA binding protein
MTTRKEGSHLEHKDEVLTTQEAARLLKTTQRTIYRWIVAGVLPAAKFGGRWRIRRVDVERFWQQRDK